MSYKPIFDEAAKAASVINLEDTFESFHDYPELYHFIVAPQSQLGTDTSSIRDARNIDAGLTERLIRKGPSLIGGGSKEIDGVESRHILTMVYLVESIGYNWGNVVEIGGGYGNYPRLAQDIITYSSWSIVDLYHIQELQDWFLNKFDIKDVDLIRTAEDYDKLEPTVVIGIHSLSEFSLEDFEMYYNKIISWAEYFFYVSHRTNPSEELLRAKKEIIARDFTLKSSQIYEDSTSEMMLFINTGQ